ncbi:MAG: phosphoglucosamine mutase [Planctomycetes bacterium]|nr:phosphoglucosamine mutase [Planctomycetota bacterium]
MILVRISPTPPHDEDSTPTMDKPRYFGTDGIRDVANRGTLLPERVLALGRGLGVLARESTGAVAIAMDPRRSSALLRSALLAGIASEGASVLDLGVLPTPALAVLLKPMRAAFGAMVSASHNPAEDNGIKVLNADGSKATEADELRLESFIDGSAPRGAERIGADVGVIETCADAVGLYEGQLLARFPGLSLRGLKIVVDAANGATAVVAPQLLHRLGADVIALHAQPDGININAGCGAVHPASMAQAVLAHGAHVGVAFDGDGDRAIFASHDGVVRDGDSVLYACGLDRHVRGRLPGATVVGTVMSNFGLELALRDAGIALARTPVGDRHVAALLREREFALGGEPSGHVIFGAEHGYVGDGLVCALSLFELITRTKRSLAHLVADLKPVPQVLLNLRVRAKPPVAELPTVVSAMDAAEKALAGSGRVLVRYSGTENLLRVMVEGRDAGTVDATAQAIFAAAKIAIGAPSAP